MNNRYKIFLFLILLFGTYLLGMICGKYKIFPYGYLQAIKTRMGDKKLHPWPKEFSIIEIDKEQKAYFYQAKGSNPQPLAVVLHTWSGDYTQYYGSLAEVVLDKNWNYIHPDFRGANNKPEACGSDLVISDIDKAIDYAIAHANVDLERIYVIGCSGGGYATLCMFMKSRHRIKTFSAWVAISDLRSWYRQSLGRRNSFAEDILQSTSSSEGTLNVVEATRRSPMYQKTPVAKLEYARLKLYAGIHDGYTGSVPITQSLLFFNKVVQDLPQYQKEDLISEGEILQLLTDRYKIKDCFLGKIGHREIIFQKKVKNISIVIFEGGHEILEEYAMEDL
ncbi:MAG: prolyl oligopeptidase family serine peptidase [Candidatus Brocadiae bacterium]|nr:prolyl oligopeptidase family serine peptidase [Candidatus Brocadiia bacterium]